MQIGDKVTYTEEYLGGDARPYGEVVEPTERELEAVRNSDMAVGPQHGDHLVEWNDGYRYWEQPSDLVKLEGVS